MSLQLSVTPNNAQAVTLSWSETQPIGIIDYLIFYYHARSQQVRSVSTTSLTTTIPNLSNGVIYNFRTTAFVSGYCNGTMVPS